MTPAQGRLKTGVRESVDAAGGIERAAELVERKRSWVGEWNAQQVDKFPPVDAAAKMDAVASAMGKLPPITLAMARENGCVLIRLPEARDAEGDWLAMVGGLSAEVGDIINGIAKATADRKVDVREAAALRIEVAEGQQKLAEIDAALAAIEGAK